MSTSPSCYFLLPHKNNRNPQILRNSPASAKILATASPVLEPTQQGARGISLTICIFVRKHSKYLIIPFQFLPFFFSLVFKPSSQPLVNRQAQAARPEKPAHSRGALS